MQCPVCSVPLTMSERQGVEIDYCPQCRGVWLDRGELDKILERAAAEAGPSAGAQPGPAYRPEPGYAPPQGYRPEPEFRRPKYDRDDDDGDYHRRKRRKSWLEDLFD